MSLKTAEDPTAQVANSAPTALPAGISPLLTREGLAEYYVVSLWTVNQWMQQGLPTEPVALRGARFDLDRVKAWMAANNLRQSA